MTTRKIYFGILLLIASICAWGQVTSKGLGSGVLLFQDISSNPPIMAHWIRIDMRLGAQMTVELAQDQIIAEDPTKGREVLSSASGRHRAVAAINGDFFPYTGDPLGFCVRGNTIISEPYPGRVAVGWNSAGKVVMGVPKWNAVIVASDGSTYPLGGLNRTPKRDEAILLTPIFGTRLVTNFLIDKVTIPVMSKPPTVGSTISCTVGTYSQEVMEAVIPKQGAVLVATGLASQFLREHATAGAKLELRMQVDEEVSWKSCQEVIGGGPWLVKDGKVFVDAEAQGFEAKFYKNRHPRSAVGVTEGGALILLAVDGRQSMSKGMSLDDLARYMLGLGVVNAINLDGGGSTELIARGSIINNPSDGSERAISNLITVLAPIRANTLEDEFSITPAEATLQIGGSCQFTVTSDKTQKALNNDEIVWGNTPGIGFIDQNGKFHAFREGDACISAWVNGRLLRAAIHIAQSAQPQTPSVQTPDEPGD
ncbi:MAG: phosphodiester glycosidase family protein [bacterium]